MLAYYQDARQNGGEDDNLGRISLRQVLQLAIQPCLHWLIQMQMQTVQ